ncbi:GNAT family N-acetyltransferase [Actinoplanes xinjiangensis]|jgi:GNAT superfamily N-acetyltransferase|uniref:Ribosomal protein S18 acetylase RimI-like enzyme n=1 Tax=Actinoplanes xinjiangensis TaxID=512350 RepID=A0A316FX88_9ACTN|nr:GNAT family N-acetyltransferase [Actinoplanes xinjiangensis]PWK46697.1 ribosomal protein S18 acetylase RimI-like enzyme [Actinoplanes xinjiangensis]GIF40480.1 N-acetyltransferase [Actinoplanes xinjiangensis]
MENWDVRRVTPDDAGRMRALRLEMLADSPLAFLETLAQAAARPHESYRQRIRQSSEGPDTAQFIVDPGGPLLGHAGGTTVPGEPGCTVIFAVYLTPAHRGGKMLGQLVEAVADWSAAAGRDELLLEVVCGNDRAVRAYEKLGFTDTGVRLPHPTVRALTELQMRRRV